MTDIVERLRELYQFAAQQKSRDWDEQDEIRDLFKYTFNVAYEAVEEIERLREENTYLQQIIKEYQRAMGFDEECSIALGEKE